MVNVMAVDAVIDEDVMSVPTIVMVQEPFVASTVLFFKQNSLSTP